MIEPSVKSIIKKDVYDSFKIILYLDMVKRINIKSCIFTKEILQIVNRKYCIAFNSCSTAIFTALKILSHKKA